MAIAYGLDELVGVKEVDLAHEICNLEANRSEARSLVVEVAMIGSLFRGWSTGWRRDQDNMV